MQKSIEHEHYYKIWVQPLLTGMACLHSTIRLPYNAEWSVTRGGQSSTKKDVTKLLLLLVWHGGNSSENVTFTRF